MVSDAEQGQPAPAHLTQGRTTITTHCKLQEVSLPLLQCKLRDTFTCSQKAWLQRRRIELELVAICVMEGLAEPPGVCTGAAAVSHRHKELLQLAHDGILQQIRAIRSICKVAGTTCTAQDSPCNSLSLSRRRSRNRQGPSQAQPCSGSG